MADSQTPDGKIVNDWWDRPRTQDDFAFVDVVTSGRLKYQIKTPSEFAARLKENRLVLVTEQWHTRASAALGTLGKDAAKPVMQPLPPTRPCQYVGGTPYCKTHDSWHR